jgi:hypothetical protein
MYVSVVAVLGVLGGVNMCLCNQNGQVDRYDGVKETYCCRRWRWSSFVS